MQGILGRSLSSCFRQRHLARGLPSPSSQFPHCPKLFPVAQSQVAHVTIELPNPFRFLVSARRLPDRLSKRGLGSLTSHRTNDMHRPGRRLLKFALNRKRPLVRLIGQFHRQTRRWIRQNQRFANFKILNRKGPPLKQLHSRLQGHLNKSSPWKNNVRVDLMVAQIRHVSAVEASQPCRRCPRHPRIQKPLPSRRQTPVPQFTRLVPPTAPIPRIGWQRKQLTRRRHRCKIHHHSRAMQRQNRIQKGLELALTANRSRHRGFLITRSKTLLDRHGKRRMRADFQPHIHSKISHRIDR